MKRPRGKPVVSLEADAEAPAERRREDRLVRKLVAATPVEQLVAWAIERARTDKPFREELLRGVRHEYASTAEALCDVRGALDRGEDAEDAPPLPEQDRFVAALHRLYADGARESLLPLLRECIAWKLCPVTWEEFVDDVYELASWVLEDLQWSSYQRLEWFGETSLATGYGWLDYVEDFVPSAEDWGRYADALLARLARHEVVWNDPLVGHTAATLRQAGRDDEAYDVIVKHAPVAGGWYEAVFILKDRPREWQIAFARPLVDAIKRWDGPEGVQQHALECAEHYLRAALGVRLRRM